MLMQATAHGRCTDTVSESVLKADSGRKITCHLGARDSNPQPASLLRLAFQLDALPIELFPYPRKMTNVHHVRVLVS